MSAAKWEGLVPSLRERSNKMTAINILLGLVAAVLLLGVIGEKNPAKNQNITISFVATVALIIALNTFM